MKPRNLLHIGLAAVVLSALFSFNYFEKRFFRKRFLDPNPKGEIYIIVDKSDYELHIFDQDGWYASYPVVFGSKNQQDKYMEGDKRTPEGNFRIISKRPHEKWNKMLMLDYPNKESWEKFKERKAKGLIPKNAKIGGGIALHGTWPNDNIVVDDFTNWTNGCVSLKNNDLDEIAQWVNVGTRVTIRR